MKKFLLNSGILALQPFITKIIVYFVLPLYTLCLTPVEFGEVEYLLAIGVFFKTFISMSMTSSFWKYIGDGEKWKEGEVIFSILLISASLGFCITVLFFLYCILFQDFSALNTNLIIYFVSEIISVTYVVVNLVIRNNFNIKKFLGITFLYVIVFISANYLFLYFLELKTSGVFYAYLLSAVIVSIGSLTLLRKHVVANFDKSLVKDIIAYSFPLMITNIVAIVIIFSDRILIKNLLGSYELGIYSFGFKFGSLIKSVLIDVFFIVWNPIRWKIYRSSTGEKNFFVISKMLMLGFPLIGFISVILSDILARLLAGDPEFTVGLRIIPFISFGYVFYGLYYYSIMGLLFTSKTKIIAKIVLYTSIFNIILNCILINCFSYLGAGIGAFITYVIMFITGHYFSNKYYNLGEVNFRVLSLIILYLMIVTFLPYNLLYSVVLSFVFIVLIILSNLRDIKYIKSNYQLVIKSLTNVY